MFGCERALLIAASIMAIRSCFSAPLIFAGSIIDFTATTVPLHNPLYT